MTVGLMQEHFPHFHHVFAINVLSVDQMMSQVIVAALMELEPKRQSRCLK